MPSLPKLGLRRASTSSQSAPASTAITTPASTTNTNTNTNTNTTNSTGLAPNNNNNNTLNADAVTNEGSSPTNLEPSSTPSSPTVMASNNTSPAAPKPRFLSRLNLPLPLRNRNRNLVDFHIRPDEPHRKYSAGDTVTGVVVLAVVKPLRITHLTVALNGYVQVFKDPASKAKSHPPRSQSYGHGFVRLFEDEQVLQGDGRLGPGKYEFGFNLEFPSSSLPSSINFELGAISYTITSTLTRPTSINATTSVDMGVQLVEQVDVGLLPPPRPNRFFLEPRTKRTRRKKSMGLDKVSIGAPENNDAMSEPDSVDPSVHTEDSGREPSNEMRNLDMSDLRSEISGESGRSVSTGISRADFVNLTPVGTGYSSAKHQQTVDKNTITATIELLKSGCLPGDTVSVRVSVQHIRPVKSMNGIVVTLYRHTKIDTSPPHHKFPDGMVRPDAQSSSKEEPVPRSWTGLGGLSLSSSGSTNVFRKDLDQNTGPMIIDPYTLQTSVTISVKLPNDSFPSIKNVPGEMVTFKYQVEVIVDLAGRFSRSVEGGMSARSGPLGSNSSGVNDPAYGPRRTTHIADTLQMRRAKGVISLAMETVVGTADSSRSKARAQQFSSRSLNMAEADENDAQTDLNTFTEEPQHDSPRMADPSEGYFPSQYNGYRYHPPRHPPSNRPYQPSASAQLRHTYTVNGYYEEESPAYIAPPVLADQSNMTEKERIRQAETRLLPSEPPIAGPSSAGPSSPYDGAPLDGDHTPTLPSSAPIIFDDGAQDGPSAPTQEDLSAATPPAEDKQELERRRLMNEASAPPEVPEDVETPEAGPSRRDEDANDQPSAPVLDDHDDYNDYPGYGMGASASSTVAQRQDTEQLPAYER